jgi:hypothetical protein
MSIEAAPPLALPPLSDVQSAQLVELCNRFSADVFEWLDRAVRDQPREVRIPLKTAVSNVAFVLTERLLYPAYLQRPDLVPPELQADL